MSWFNVDKAGLAAVLERRGKSFAIFELVSNAYDSGAQNVWVDLKPIDGSPYATLLVEDDSTEGWDNLDHAYTMFAKSKRGSDPLKSGRFNLGEKLVLAISREATIKTMAGSIHFAADGNRRNSSEKRESGTQVICEIRMTREELADAMSDIARIIPRCATTINGRGLEKPTLLKTFTAKLPTEIQDSDGNLRRTMRQATVEVYESADGGEVAELGMPIARADWTWRLNVIQKIPLNVERDGVTDGFRKALQVAAVNAMANMIDEEQVSQPWVQEAVGDARATTEAVKTVITKQFGENAVIATVGDPIANAQAEAAGATVIHGGALSSGVWANIRKGELLTTTAKAFPSMSPAQREKMHAPGVCPMCGQPT